MNHSQTVDLHDVDAYFKIRNLVDDKHRPYYLRWIQRFLTGPWGAGRLAPNDALAAFTQHLEQVGHTEEWQVRQAIRSVELFQKHYLRHLQETGAEVPAAIAGQVVVGDDDFGALDVIQHVAGDEFAGGVIVVRGVGQEDAQAVLDGDAGGADEKAAGEWRTASSGSGV